MRKIKMKFNNTFSSSIQVGTFFAWHHHDWKAFQWFIVWLHFFKTKRKLIIYQNQFLKKKLNLKILDF